MQQKNKNVEIDPKETSANETDRLKEGIFYPRENFLPRFLIIVSRSFEQSNTRTQSYKENFSVDYRYAGIRAFSLADKSHMTIFSQSEA